MPKTLWDSAQNNTDALKSWVMVFLTLAFVVLYGLALIGKLKPLADASMVSRIEPIVFVVIGYYFGRLPTQQNEQMLKNEITRQTQKADAAQHAKEQILQSRETLEEKLKSVNAALDFAETSLISDSTTKADDANQVSVGNLTVRHSVAAARRVLNT